MSQAKQHWAACWGTATSITDRKEATFGKRLTLRYPLYMCFDGDRLRFHFSNLTGTEVLTISHASVALTPAEAPMSRRIQKQTLTAITFQGKASAQLAPGGSLTSDEIGFTVHRGDYAAVSLYFDDYVQLNAGTLVTGPLSHGYFAYGDHADSEDLPDDLCRNTNWYYFLNTVDVLTDVSNHALICYGDSITAQDWPDDLTLRCQEQGWTHTSVIRRAVCGTRILRQYDSITYAAYGLKGETRFPVELPTAGAAAVILQHGINDIIHPVGVEVNRFRPWSDLPAVEELYDGFQRLYVQPARAAGLRVYGGTLLPILGWRTYANFREDMRTAFNQLLLKDDALDGCIDFAAAVCDPADPRAFAPGFDSGDHLHPSAAAYRAMADAVPEELLRG